MIYHLLPRARWERQPPDELYSAASLADEGFIHCTAERDWLLRVANHFYRDEPGEWVALVIDEARVSSEIRWEMADGHRFPHIYGPLNLDAIIHSVSLPRGEDGEFLLPLGWQG